mgnify:CR=1 FL=1
MLSLVLNTATALDAAALDSSPSALAAATTTVNIGTPNWNAYPITPASYTVSVGDKLSFQFTQSHNVWVKPASDCVFTGGTELASSICGADESCAAGGDGQLANLYEVVPKTAGTLYIACQVGYCLEGQKVEIIVEAVPDSPAPPPPQPPPDNEENSAEASGPTSWLAVMLAAVASLAVWTSDRDAAELYDIRSALGAQ